MERDREPVRECGERSREREDIVREGDPEGAYKVGETERACRERNKEIHRENMESARDRI